MANLSELARLTPKIDINALQHLQRLVASWGLVADFCFADLLLFAPANGAASTEFVVMGQIRPTTSQTLYREDLVKTVVDDVERPLVARAFRLGEEVEGEMTLPGGQRARVRCIPVRYQGRLVGILTRETDPERARSTGELERTYLEIFDRFAAMISSGTFPFTEEETAEENAPRVGDGVVLLDESAKVAYASPNAISTLHRLAIHANAEGARLGDLGLHGLAVRRAYTLGLPTTEEIERGRDVVVVLRCIPLLDHDITAGAVVLLRDVSELRRRDLLLLSKDATIREIHHRVKNNLQTISSLLRLQARRLDNRESKLVIEESVRRIRSIALVHEQLSKAAGEDVPFLDIVRPLVRMVEEGLTGPDHPVSFVVEGDGGTLPAPIATGLSVVMNELLQNAVDHAFPRHKRPEGGTVKVSMTNDGRQLTIVVRDDGIGVPEGFSVEHGRGLGTSIIHTLVTTELDGTIEVDRVDDSEGTGTLVTITVPVVSPSAR